MALTDTQKQKCRDYLGIPSLVGFLTVGNAGPDLVQRLDALSAEAEAQVIVLLTKIDTSRTDIEGARGRLKASEVGDIKLNQMELKQRWREDLYLCQQLGNIVQMAVQWHPSRSGNSTPEVIA